MEVHEFIIDLRGKGLTKAPFLDIIEQTATQIYIDNNNIILLNLSFSDLKKLSVFSASYCGFLTFPCIGGDLIQVLNLSHNFMKYLDCTIEFMKFLKKFYLSYNRLIELPRQMRHLKFLRILDLRHNNIMSISDEICNGLINLEELYLENNQITSWQNGFNLLRKLKILDISGNNIQVAEIKNESLVEVNLIGCSLGDFPIIEKTLPLLKKLDISYNNIIKIRDDIKNLPALEILHASYNNLTDISPEIEKLGRLVGLKLDNNMLKYIPPIINISFLHAYNNELTAIQNAPTLKVLNIANNSIKKMPISLALECLFAENNDIDEIPDDIIHMTRLKQLDLSDNNITKVSVGLLNLKQLELIKIMYNPAFTKRNRVSAEIYNFVNSKEIKSEDDGNGERKNTKRVKFSDE